MYFVPYMVEGDGVVPLPVGSVPAFLFGSGISLGRSLRLVSYRGRCIAGKVFKPLLVAQVDGQCRTEVQPFHELHIEVVGAGNVAPLALILHVLHGEGIELVVVVGTHSLIIPELMVGIVGGSRVLVRGIIEQGIGCQCFGIYRVIVHIVALVGEIGAGSYFQPALYLCVGIDTSVVFTL